MRLTTALTLTCLLTLATTSAEAGKKKPATSTPTVASTPKAAVWKGSLSAANYDKQTVNKVNDLALGCQAENSPVTVEGDSVSHHTIPRANIAIFFKCEGGGLVVYGIGEHKGKTNKKYAATWHNGKKVTINL